jgi:hypothetical protein
VISRPWRWFWTLLAGMTLVSCTRETVPAAPAPQAILAAIPAADSSKYDHIQDMRNWRNPYLIVRPEGVALYDSADSAEILLKPEELLAALARLPVSYWPYGRVVAAQENAVHASDQDGVAIRRMKGIIGGELRNANVAVKWVPSG